VREGDQPTDLELTSGQIRRPLFSQKRRLGVPPGLFEICSGSELQRRPVPPRLAPPYKQFLHRKAGPSGISLCCAHGSAVEERGSSLFP